MSGILVDLPMAFGNKQTEELVSFDLIATPVGVGTYDLPDGVKRSELEEVVISLDYAGAIEFRGGNTFKKSQIISGEKFIIQESTPTTSVSAQLSFVSETQFTVSSADPLVRVRSIIASKKKYATTNLSVTIHVNGGNAIITNARYEIQASELPASFLDENGNIKKNVKVTAEVFNNSGTGIADFTETRWNDHYEDGNHYTYGALANVIGDVIAVKCGNSGVMGTAKLTGNASENTVVVISAPCQVIATLSGEALTVQTA